MPVPSAALVTNSEVLYEERFSSEIKNMHTRINAHNGTCVLIRVAFQNSLSAKVLKTSESRPQGFIERNSITVIRKSVYLEQTKYSTRIRFEYATGYSCAFNPSDKSQIAYAGTVGAVCVYVCVAH